MNTLLYLRKLLHHVYMYLQAFKTFITKVRMLVYIAQSGKIILSQQIHIIKIPTLSFLFKIANGLVIPC